MAVALPTAGQRFDPDAITVDGNSVQGVYRDSDQQIWIALTAGAHTVKLTGHLAAADSIQLLFPQVPRAIAVSGEGWDFRASCGQTAREYHELLRRRVAGHDANSRRALPQFPPYVRVRRGFAIDLDWSVNTTVERLAPKEWIHVGGSTARRRIRTYQRDQDEWRRKRIGRPRFWCRRVQLAIGTLA